MEMSLLYFKSLFFVLLFICVVQSERRKTMDTSLSSREEKWNINVRKNIDMQKTKLDGKSSSGGGG